MLQGSWIGYFPLCLQGHREHRRAMMSRNSFLFTRPIYPAPHPPFTLGDLIGLSHWTFPKLVLSPHPDPRQYMAPYSGWQSRNFLLHPTLFPWQKIRYCVLLILPPHISWSHPHLSSQTATVLVQAIISSCLDYYNMLVSSQSPAFHSLEARSNSLGALAFKVENPLRRAVLGFAGSQTSVVPTH